MSLRCSASALLPSCAARPILGNGRSFNGCIWESWHGRWRLSPIKAASCSGWSDPLWLCVRFNLFCDLVIEGFHVDPKLAAAIESEAGIEALGVLGNSAKDGSLGPVGRAVDGTARSLAVAGEQLEIGSFGPEIGTGAPADGFGFCPNGHPYGVTRIFFRRTDALSPPHPGTTRRRAIGLE